MDIKTFRQVADIERKLERQEALTPAEQEFVKTHDIREPKRCGNKDCDNLLGPRVDGEHKMLGDVVVCEDCYYDAFGKELEDFPILPPRIRRRG